jgi:hypothetical protein
MGTRDKPADMTENIELATITDINYLKAMVYDRSMLIQQANQEIQVINERIQQLAAPVPEMNGKVASKT